MDLSYLYFQLCRKKLPCKKKVGHTVYGNKILDTEIGGKLIEKYLRQDEPCMIARIGSVEIQAINAVTNVEQGLRKCIPEGHLKVLGNNAGFFSCDRRDDKALFGYVSKCHVQILMLQHSC